MTAFGLDPRANRSIGDPSGLARRVTEAEKRLSRMAVQQSDNVGTYIPTFRVGGSGPVGTAAPPNGTTGTTFTVPVTGVYLIATTMTAFKTSAIGSVTGSIYIDGSLIGTSEKFFNELGSHQVLHHRWLPVSLATGTTHYIYLATTLANTSTDANDRWDCMGFRVGAL